MQSPTVSPSSRFSSCCLPTCTHHPDRNGGESAYVGRRALRCSNSPPLSHSSDLPTSSSLSSPPPVPLPPRGFRRAFKKREFFDDEEYCARLRDFYHIWPFFRWVFNGIISVSIIFACVSSCVKGEIFGFVCSYREPDNEYGPASDVNKWTEQWSVVIPTALFWIITSVLASGSRHFRPFRLLKGRRWVEVLEVVGIIVPLLIFGTPLLAFSADLVLSFGLAGVDVHVLQAVAIFGAIFIGHSREAIFLLLLFKTAHTIEDSAKMEAQSARDVLEASTPKLARVFTPFVFNPNDFNVASASHFSNFSFHDSDFRTFSVSNVTQGSIVKVIDGEVVPLKSIIISATNPYFTQAHLDGETTPRRGNIASSIPAGAVLVDGGPVYLGVTHGEDEGEWAHLKNLISSIDKNIASLDSFFDTLEKVYSKIMIIASLSLLYFLPRLPKKVKIPLKGPRGAYYRTIAFLIAAAPCALVLSTPIAHWSTYSVCLQNEIGIVSMNVFDHLGSVNHVVLDKTGTLTSNVRVRDIRQLPLLSSGEVNMEEVAKGLPESIQKNATRILLASFSLALEEGIQRQPHARAIVDWAWTVLRRATNSSSIPTLEPINSFRPQRGGSTSRRGRVGRYRIGRDEVEAAVGATDFVYEKLNIPGGEDAIHRLERLIGDESSGLSLLGLRDQQNSTELYVIAFDDKLRPGAEDLVQEFQSMGIEVSILSGDSLPRVSRVARSLGVDPSHIHAAMSPTEKLRFIQRLSEKAVVAMVGDELNDAPAMKASRVGIAIGDAGSPVALSSDVAKVILYDDTKTGKVSNLSRLLFLFHKSRACWWVILENLCVALIGLLIVAPCAVAARIPLWLAVLGHEGGTVIVSLNSLRLLALG